METMLNVRDIVKHYGSHPALTGISFTAGEGEIIALLGRNGAGKSTLMNILTGYIAMSSGTAAICGHDVQQEPLAARKLVGYLPELPPLYPDMTVTAYLHYCCALKGIPAKQRKQETERVIQATALQEYARRLSGKLSKGYRQRLGLAQAQLGSPKLLILDEPGSGLDPLQMTQMRETIRKAGEQATILLSSHILSEVTELCTRALVIDHGTLRYDGPMTGLLSSSGCLHVGWKGEADLLEGMTALPGVRRVQLLPPQGDSRRAQVWHDGAASPAEDIFRLAVARQATLTELTPCQEALEGAFLHLLREEETP